MTSAPNGIRLRTKRAWRRAGAAVMVIALTGLSGALAAVPAAAATVRTGTLALTPATATAGDTADVFIFTYTAPAKPGLGTISIDVPAGFSSPQDSNPSGAGYLSVSSACAQFQVTGVAADGVGGNIVAVAENCAAALKATLIYALVAVPTTAGAYPVATSFTPSGGTAVPFARQHAITVRPGALASISLSPATATIVAGDSQAYTASGFDAYGNAIGTLAGAKFTIKPDGSCSGATCTASVAGTHTVTATSKKISATATLTVLPGPGLAVSETVSNATPFYYAPVTFTTNVTNTSTTSTADGVTVAVNVPAGLISPAGTTSTGSYDASTSTWAIGSLAAGATATLSITADAADPGDGIQTVTATVTSTTIDSNPNNTASAAETSQPPPVEAFITPDAGNENPVDVCDTSATETWYGSTGNAANPAAPPSSAGNVTYSWTCETSSPSACPTPVNFTPGSASLTYANSDPNFLVGATYTIILTVTPDDETAYREPVSTSFSFTTTCLE